MEEADIEKVNDLARNLYEKHLAGSMDEAVEKAKAIILGSENMIPVGTSVEKSEEVEKELDKFDEEFKEEMPQRDDVPVKTPELDRIEGDLAEKELEDIEDYKGDFKKDKKKS